MAQIRVAQNAWEGKDKKAQAARKCWCNGVFLNDPALIDGFYVWDDHRVTDDHQFIMDQCISDTPTAQETAAVVLARVQGKLDARLQGRVSVKLDGINLDDPLVPKP